MIINHNMASLNTYRQLSTNNANSAKSLEKLSSGLRINKAGDDAAGLAISEKMRGQIRGLDQASRNAQDGISMIQTAEGGLNETHSILQRMRELAVQAGNDTNNSDDRDAINDELTQLKTEIDRISSTTSFNGKKLLNGDLAARIDNTGDIQKGVAAGDASVVSAVDVTRAKAGETYTFDGSVSGKITLTRLSDSVAQTLDLNAVAAGTSEKLDFSQLGVSITIDGTNTADEINTGLDTKTIKTATGNASAEFLIGSNGGDAAETLSVSFSKIDSSTLGNITTAGNTLATDLSTFSTNKDKASAETLVATLDRSIKDVSKQRSLLGAAQNRLEHTISNLGTSSENLTAAESRVRDVDMAKEMMAFQKNNILSQAAQAMLAQANQAPQGVLQLLR